MCRAGNQREWRVGQPQLGCSATELLRRCGWLSGSSPRKLVNLGAQAEQARLTDACMLPAGAALGLAALCVKARHEVLPDVQLQ